MLQITRDVPGRAFELHEASTSLLQRGGGVVLCLAPVWLAPVFLVAWCWNGVTGLWEPPTWVDVNLFGAYYSLAVLPTWFALRRVSYLSSLIVDRSRGTLEAVYAGFLGRTSGRLEICLEDTGCIRLWTDPDVGSAELPPRALHLRVESVTGKGLLALTVRVEGVQDDVRVVDFALHISTAMGFCAYTLELYSFLQIRFRAMRQSEEGSQPLPEVISSWRDDYEADDSLPVHVPIEALSLDACGFRSAYQPSWWEPGQYVQLEHRWTFLVIPARAISALVGLGLGTAFGLWAPEGIKEPVLLRDSNLAIAFLSGIGLFGYLALLGPEVRRLCVDWESRTLKVRRDHRRVTIAFDDVVSIQVRLRRTRDETTGLCGAACYQGSIVVVFLDTRWTLPEEIVVLETCTAEGDPVTPFKWASGFAVSLAGWLDVPCHYRRRDDALVPIHLGQSIVDDSASLTDSEQSPIRAHPCASVDRPSGE